MYTLPCDSWIANSDLGGSSCPDAILDDRWSTGDEPWTDEDPGWKGADKCLVRQSTRWRMVMVQLAATVELDRGVRPKGEQGLAT